MRLLIAIFFLSCLFSAQADDKYFQGRFNTAKSYLAEGKTAEALPIFQQLVDIDPTNSNLHYLLGVCYTEESIITDKSIVHLEKSIKNVSIEYDPSSYKERRTPIFVYYFLVVAYSQNKLCEQSQEAYQYFVSVYGKSEKDFYIKDAKEWVKKCTEKILAREDKPIKTTEKPKYNGEIVTKTIVYTTSSPLYGVQVGAFSRLVPVYEFENVKNVEAFMDKNGVVRYVIGHFRIRKQAETLLSVVKKASYPDAFIVDVNSERKYRKEVVSVDNQSLKKKPLKPKVDFKVQIGAFQDSIPGWLAEKYLQVDGIEETDEGDLTVLTSGLFPHYEEAATYREELLQLGIPGAFVVAYNRQNQKVALKKVL